MGSGRRALYCHLPMPSDDGGDDYFTKVVELDGVGSVNALTFGAIKKAFLQECKSQNKVDAETRDVDYQLHTRSGLALSDVSNVFAWMISSPTGGETSEAGTSWDIDPICRDLVLTQNLDRHLAKQGELSYYYAHSDRPPARVPDSWRPTPLVDTNVMISADVKRENEAKHNKRQSPFGTDIEKYETIVKYSFEDADNQTVKVFVPLSGIGKINPENVTSRFSEREFELLVEGYEGKNLRLGCSKTHEKMDASKCKHVIRANRINLVIRKAKHGDIWFDLFKKKAIGDDEKP